MDQQDRFTIAFDMTIVDGGVKDTTSKAYQGHLYQRQAFDVLTYEDVLEDGSVIRNLITIHPHKVTIKRSGAVTTTQQFIVDQKTESVYEHPYGAMHMETYTSSVDYRPIHKGVQGKLTITYTVTLNHTEERQHKLVLSYSKEDVE